VRKNEVVLSYEITDTKAGDGETLPVLLKQAQANLPAGRIKTLACDKTADSEDVHELHSSQGITPLIQMRGLWQTEPERMLPGHDSSNGAASEGERAAVGAGGGGLNGPGWHRRSPREDRGARA